MWLLSMRVSSLEGLREGLGVIANVDRTDASRCGSNKEATEIALGHDERSLASCERVLALQA